jgi:Lipopolysaccharide assembly protein A domain
VTVSLDPFSTDQPAAAVALPLFGLIIVLLILGVVIGGMAAWLRQSKWRRTARRLERELGDLRGEMESLKRTAEPMHIPGQINPPERLKLRPPMG